MKLTLAGLLALAVVLVAAGTECDGDVAAERCHYESAPGCSWKVNTLVDLYRCEEDRDAGVFSGKRYSGCEVAVPEGACVEWCGGGATEKWRLPARARSQDFRNDNAGTSDVRFDAQ